MSRVMNDDRISEPSAEALGPVDFLILEVPADHMDGSAGEALMDLVDRGTVSILDLLVVRKDADGSFVGLELSDLRADQLGGLALFAGARSGLVDDEDVEEAAALLAPGQAAALIVYENTWARPFVTAALRSGAQVVASQRIPAEVVNEAVALLDELDGLDDGDDAGLPASGGV